MINKSQKKKTTSKQNKHNKYYYKFSINNCKRQINKGLLEIPDFKTSIEKNEDITIDKNRKYTK